MKLTERIKSNTTRVLVTGLPGSGKSTLVSKLSSQFHLHWITLDNDIDVLKKLPLECQENIDVYDIPDSAAFPIAAETLMKLFKDGKGDICHAHGKISCPLCKKESLPSSLIDFSALNPHKDIVVIDTATQLGHSILAHVTKSKPVDYKPERDDWGGLRKFTEFFCSQFQAARFNLVVICHVVEAEMEDDRVKLVPNFGSKAMSAEFAKAFSEVVYCEVINKKHRAYSSSTATNNVLTKSRTDFKIEDLPEPSLLPIFQRADDGSTLISINTATNSQPVSQVQSVDSQLSALDKLKAKQALSKIGVTK